MNLMNTGWQALLAGVDVSDPAAVARRRRETQDDLVRLVARALRRGTATTALDRRVLAAARVLAWQHPERAADHDWLVRQVAGSVSREMLADAPAPLAGQGQFETVCA
jgi:hypothetical protein